MRLCSYTLATDIPMVPLPQGTPLLNGASLAETLRGSIALRC